ncbi:unnamed protein product (macronuclear) [Paramecium tetraurelia]|uniref:Amino acid transporter transmembrane domain-containing protein n=1 Tax=Paramecium tetraurelia TaxID=5888 RepID=A0DIL5_PARTE|nr:uncharacterized protein GSPATT00017239001 [Paramecium tetraurelia]CAK82882.1 unnamed protein product [Paramecium tetraurelia]|eukprot:XP_001450279.1 hypothetical protein (macronuclear) [Paramecium tetraurelia strain d4-2]
MENREIEDSSKLKHPGKSHKSTATQAYFNFIKSNLGIGVIVLPVVTYQVGLLWSIFLFVPIAFSCVKSSQFMIEIADDLNTDNILYADIIKLTLGSLWAHILDIAIILQLIGLCIAYLIFLTESLAQSLHQISIEMTKLQCLLITLIIVIPLSFVRKIHFFHSTSKYGFYAALASFCIILYDCQGRLSLIDNFQFSNLINIKNTFNYVGVAILCCEGIFTVLPIRDSMKNKFEFKSVASKSLMTAFCISIFLSLITSSTYQQETQSIVLFSIQNPILEVVSLILYSISLLLTFPLQLFPAVQIVETMLQKNMFEYISFHDIEQNSNEGSPTEKIDKSTCDKIENLTCEKDDLVFEDRLLQSSIRSMLMLTIYFIAYYVPHLSHFLNLIGSIFGSLLQFCFPVLVHIIYFKNSKSTKPVIQYTIILIVSILAIVLGTAESLKHLL